MVRRRSSTAGWAAAVAVGLAAVAGAGTAVSPMLEQRLVSDAAGAGELLAGPGEPEITVFLGPGGTVPLTLVHIPAGAFAMGSPDAELGRGTDESQHQVTLTHDVYLEKTELTRAQWRAVMGTDPASDYGAGGDNPVYEVSWNDIAGTGGFLERLDREQGTTDFRLPTEAEWEYAARAGTTTEFSFPTVAVWDMYCGPFAEADTHMWWCPNSGFTTHPVAEMLANPWGLFDVHGNVAEWVQDWYGPYPADAQIDPRGPAAGSGRVVRGGSFYDLASDCRSAHRVGLGPDVRDMGIGFRLAMTPGALVTIRQVRRWLHAVAPELR
jgi:formylglycine-generating enzyme required for sulfatase activity